MATISTDTYLDDGTARTAGEVWTNNGGSLIIRTDTRVHANAPVSMTGSLGSLTCSSTLGGGMLIDGTKVREVWFNSGSGTVPPIGTTISQGGVNGYLLGVWPDQTSAPITPGSAMPATGFMKFREVTGSFTSGSLVGITANATGADIASWIEIIADQSANFTFSRLGLGKKNQGVDYFLGTTNGTIGQTFQVPTNGGGASTHVPGIKVETFPGSNDYIPWPCLATAACGWTNVTVGTDARAKLAQSVGNGVVRIGSDGTNAIGYVPPAGCKVYVPNIFERQCLAATRAVNELPSSVLATRPELSTLGGGKVDINGTLSDWYYSITNPTICTITNFLTIDSIFISNCASDVSLDTTCLGILNSSTASVFGLYLNFNKISKLLKIVVAKREFTSGTTYAVYLGACSGYKTGVYDKITTFVSLGGLRTTTIYGFAFGNSRDFYNLKLNLIGGPLFIVPAFNIQDIELDYSDTCKGTTYTTISQNAVNIANSENISFKSVTFGLNGTIINVNPFNSVINSNSSKNIKIRGIGSYNSLALNTTNPPSAIFTPANDTDVFLQRLYCNTRSSIIGSGICSKVVVESCYTTTNRTLNPVGNLGAIKGSMGGIPAAAVTGIVGNNINDYFQSSTIGAIVWFGNAPVAENAANVQLIGATEFSGGGSIVMPNLSDTATFTGTYYIKGHLSFANLAINLIGVNTANFDIYYQLDINNNNGFSGTWKLASAANLSAETISASDGFNIKIKLAVNTANSTNSLAQIKINTITSDTAQSTNLYPLDTAKISLSGLIAGSRIFVYDITNSVELINVVATATTLEQYAVYSSDATLQVRVMYATSTVAKILYETLAIFTIDGASILVSQIDDTLYALNAIDGFSQTGFTIDDIAKVISVNKPGTGTPLLSHVLWQEAYAAETAWLMTAEGIRHYPRVLLAIDTANYRLLNDFKIKNTGLYPLIISGGYGVSGTTGLSSDIFDYSGGGITTVVEHVVPYQAGVSGLTTLEHNQLMAIPINPLIATDYTAPDNTSVTAIKAKTDQLIFTGANLNANAQVVTDKTGYSVSALSANTITAASIAAAALNGKGDWNIGKTGYNVSSINPAVITTTVAPNLDAAISTRMATFTYTAPPTAAAISTQVWAETTRGLTDKAGFNVTSLGANTITATAVATAALNGKGDWLLSSGYTVPPTASAIKTEIETSTVIARQAKIDLIEAKTTPNLTVATSTLATTAALSAVATTVNTVNTNTDTIESRLPAALVGGKMDSTATDISSLATAAALSSVSTAVNTINLNTDSVEASLTTITAALPTAGAKIAGEGATIKNLDQIIPAIFSYVIEGSDTLKTFLRCQLSVLAGTMSGVGTLENRFYSRDGIKIRVKTTFNAIKERIAVILDGSD